MTTYEDIVRRWHDVTKGSKRSNFAHRANVFALGDRLYSYGRHFEMARPLRNGKGEIEAYLLNGDNFSVSTSRHQSLVRDELRGERTVIIPHTALNAAGVEPSSVKLLDVQEERWEPILHSSEKLEDVPERHRYQAEEYRRDQRPHRASAYHNEDGVYFWETTRHWLGGSLIRGRVLWTQYHQCKACNGTGDQPGADVWVVEPDYRYRWVVGNGVHRPVCEECKGSGGETRTHHRWATFLSSFDDQETRPSYFFCELPHNSKARTIAEAYEALKPDAVRMAEQMGREVSRQGDIFAVPAPSMTKAQLRKLGARIEKMGNLLGTNHAATEVAYLPGVTLARGIMHHVPQGRRPDHARRTIGDRRAWHIIQKNLVPIAA